MSMKTVARFVTRLQGENDGLFVGSLMNDGKDAFKPNTVYEIRDIMGTLTIVPVGEANGACENQCIGDDGSLWHWAQHIGDIIERWGRVMFLTKSEYQAILADRLANLSNNDTNY